MSCNCINEVKEDIKHRYELKEGVERYIKSKSHEKESCDNYNDCRICGEYKKVHECAREVDGYQRLVFICDSCLKWIKEL